MNRSLEDLRRAFADHEPVLGDPTGKARAAVALALCEADDDLSLLFIKRAAFEGDRWSGHIAFPGGRIDPGDASAREGAERETFEEVGLLLPEESFVGQLDDLAGQTESILVSAFVYGVEPTQKLTRNHEVDEAFWLPLHEIEKPGRHLQRSFRYLDYDLPLPAIRVLDESDPVLWGLSYGFLQLLMEALGRGIPPMTWYHDL